MPGSPYFQAFSFCILVLWDDPYHAQHLGTSCKKREKSVKKDTNEGEKMQILRKILVTSPPINEFNPTEYDEKKLFTDILPTDMWRITCTTPQ